MALNCCHKEYDAEECEILVCLDAPAPLNLNLYSRLRFRLLASSWLPIPLGIFLWRALHVMLLVVGGPALWVLILLTAFLYYSVLVFIMIEISVCITFVVCGLLLVAVDLVVLLVQLIRFCWSLVSCHESIVDCWWSAFCTVEFWKTLKSAARDTVWEFVAFGVPCMSGSLYKRTKNRKLETWARWCEEVVHVHEAIAL